MKYNVVRRLALLSAIGATLPTACRDTAGPGRVPVIQLLRDTATLQFWE